MELWAMAVENRSAYLGKRAKIQLQMVRTLSLQWMVHKGNIAFY